MVLVGAFFEAVVAKLSSFWLVGEESDIFSTPHTTSRAEKQFRPTKERDGGISLPRKSPILLLLIFYNKESSRKWDDALTRNSNRRTCYNSRAGEYTKP